VKKICCSFLVCLFIASGLVAKQKNHQSTKGKGKMKIELLFFDGCPTYKQALANIKAALKEKNLQADVVLINVKTEAIAEKVGFQGSPSVRINGKDIEGRDEGFNFSCRLYSVNGKPATAPGKEMILAKIDSLMP
jgi:hypothetical protein